MWKPVALGRWLLLMIFLVPGTLYAGVIVEIKGSALSGGRGENIAKFRMYASDSSGEFKAIPFQIDEKVEGKKGGTRDWAMESNHGRSSTSRGDGRLDPDEVILFLEEDAGQKLDTRKFTGAEKIWEISTGPEGVRKTYLVKETVPSPLSPKSFLQYDAETDQVVAKSYEAGFSRKHPLVQNRLVLKNGSLPFNILDRFKARFKLELKPFFEIKFNEEEIQAQVTGYRAGPIRVIRRVQASKKLGPIKLIPKSQLDFVFYPTWVEIPTKINNPVNGPTFLKKETQGLSGLDFNRLILGSQFFTNLDAPAIPLERKEVLRKWNDSEVRWWSLTGLPGSLVICVNNDENLSRLGIYPTLILKEALYTPGPPESQPGEIFIGFDLPYYKIPKGRYSVGVKQVYPLEFHHGNEGQYLKEAQVISPDSITEIK